MSWCFSLYLPQPITYCCVSGCLSSLDLVSPHSQEHTEHKTGFKMLSNKISLKRKDTITNTFYWANNHSSFLLLHLESNLNKETPVNQIFNFCLNFVFLYNFKDCFLLTGATQCWLYSSRCATPPRAYLTSSGLCLQLSHLCITLTLSQLITERWGWAERGRSQGGGTVCLCPPVLRKSIQNSPFSEKNISLELN